FVGVGLLAQVLHSLVLIESPLAEFFDDAAGGARLLKFGPQSVELRKQLAPQELAINDHAAQVTDPGPLADECAGIQTRAALRVEQRGLGAQDFRSGRLVQAVESGNFGLSCAESAFRF